MLNSNEAPDNLTFTELNPLFERETDFDFLVLGATDPDLLSVPSQKHSFTVLSSVPTGLFEVVNLGSSSRLRVVGTVPNFPDETVEVTIQVTDDGTMGKLFRFM